MRRNRPLTTILELQQRLLPLRHASLQKLPHHLSLDKIIQIHFWSTYFLVNLEFYFEWFICLFEKKYHIFLLFWLNLFKILNKVSIFLSVL
jgi:hypothetical protein